MGDFFKCEGLTKNKGDFSLKNISFSFPEGTVVGLIGVNGCGKTTLLRSILGSYTIDSKGSDSGDIWLSGKHFQSDQKEFRKQLGFVLQENPFSRNMRVLEAGEVYGYYYDGFNMDVYIKLLKEYDVPEREFISRLSAGQSLRMQLAFARSYPAKLYIMDEPAGNLDVKFRDYFYNCIREMVENETCSVIISSHLVTELEHIADRLLWINRNENESSVRYFGDIDSLKDSYRIFEGEKKEIEVLPQDSVVEKRIRAGHSEALLYRRDRDFSFAPDARYATLQEIMYYVEKSSREDDDV
ncbi:MAG: ABC transporter ATP-binding protein [Eubacterium sp.]|nr:ABC transporter ATP-binding protein [Eubacterium sp.]